MLTRSAPATPRPWTLHRALATRVPACGLAALSLLGCSAGELEDRPGTTTVSSVTAAASTGTASSTGVTSTSGAATDDTGGDPVTEGAVTEGGGVTGTSTGSTSATAATTGGTSAATDTATTADTSTTDTSGTSGTDTGATTDATGSSTTGTTDPTTTSATDPTSSSTTDPTTTGTTDPTSSSTTGTTGTSTSTTTTGGMDDDIGLVIHEVRADDASTDDAEFIELWNGTGRTLDLSSYRIAFINGDGASYTSPLTLGAPAAAVPSFTFVTIGDTTVTPAAGVFINIGTKTIQNGPDALQLLRPDGSVVDEIAYGGPVTGAGEGTPAPTDPGDDDSLSRCPSGIDTDDNATDFVVTPNATPGAPNACP